MTEGSPKQILSPITGGFSERIGLLGWLSLYVSGGVLFVLLLIHVFAIHFFAEGEIAAASVREDMGSWFLIFINVGLLFLGLFHGLIGLHRILLDLGIFGKRGNRRLKKFLYVVGAGFVLFGIVVFGALNTL
jgi:succinate dehydrogenase hydrophobic anchor subunit